ncbi:patatin-like phospholipase family protein [Acinetobacter larvae]|uniref:PNPLA domain-containing protein n=1 Tax=Acinetobacter larvae TaxID=1789224 RepID=A0A1B2M303_9GAMM|nr:patatin family protein [Acinetobacter larvae]AOA59559.1 hypothetical protein BFG52_15210 [Acinetobacter larvae]
MTKKHYALLVEGGGMRGIFTAGVLDAFLQQKFNPFHDYVGVSAGSTSLLSYLSEQKNRIQSIYLDYSLRPEFISYKRFIRGGDLLDIRWLWDKVEQEHPLDQHKVFATPQRNIYVVLTNMTTGQAEYVRAEPGQIINTLLASSALPLLVRKAIKINHNFYIDGGVADALPIQWLQQQQHIRQSMVIRTRPRQYRRDNSLVEQWSARWLFRRNPVLARAIEKSFARYNSSIHFIRRHQDSILEINPPTSKQFASRLCQDPAKLQYSYQLGYEQGQIAMDCWEQFTHLER